MSDEPSKDPPHSAETLIPQVYDELRKLANYRMRKEFPGQTITGTALLHEAYLRLKKESDGPHWVNSSHFFSAAAEAMRRILIERVRAKRRIKRGAEFTRVEFEDLEIPDPQSDDQFLEIDEALVALEKVNSEAATLVKLRYFAGLTLEETAEATGMSVRTISNRWSYARAWLADYLQCKE